MALHDGKTVCRTSRWRSKRAFVLGLLLATHWNRRVKSTFSLGTPLRATKLPDAVVDDSGWAALCIAVWCHQYMGHCGTMDDTIYWESWNRTFQAGVYPHSICFIIRSSYITTLPLKSCTRSRMNFLRKLVQDFSHLKSANNSSHCVFSKALIQIGSLPVDLVMSRS